jgi:hypothetical protein
MIETVFQKKIYILSVEEKNNLKNNYKNARNSSINLISVEIITIKIMSSYIRVYAFRLFKFLIRPKFWIRPIFLIRLNSGFETKTCLNKKF